jgi:putative iron-regulated protein
MKTSSAAPKLLAMGLALSLFAGVGCGSDGDDSSTTSTTAAGGAVTTTEAPAPGAGKLSDADATAVATTYADLVLANYDATVAAATTLKTDVDAFVADPTDATLEAAKKAWLDARDIYGPTEVFRFYDGPIDNAETGPEGQINAWPLDEAYIDYVEDDAEAGIVNDVDGFPEITTEVLVAANEEGGETNISTGWHAIEFLLWGQDLSDDGPGARPVTDYTTADNADRRGTYLTLLTDLLVSDLTSVRDQWATEGGTYRTEFLAAPQDAVKNILTGMGTLSSGELAGERMATPYEAKDQEDEHSCFSDNTLADIAGNAIGIRLAYTADFEGIEGTSLSSVVEKIDPEADAAMLEQLDANVAAAQALEGPFDQIITAEDDDPQRAALLELITGLQTQGDAIAELAAALGFEITVTV